MTYSVLADNALQYPIRFRKSSWLSTGLLYIVETTEGMQSLKTCSKYENWWINWWCSPCDCLIISYASVPLYVSNTRSGHQEGKELNIGMLFAHFPFSFSIDFVWQISSPWEQPEQHWASFLNLFSSCWKFLLLSCFVYVYWKREILHKQQSTPESSIVITFLKFVLCYDLNWPFTWALRYLCKLVIYHVLLVWHHSTLWSTKKWEDINPTSEWMKVWETGQF